MDGLWQNVLRHLYLGNKSRIDQKAETDGGNMSKEIRDELQGKLAKIRDDCPEIAKEIWDLFKTIRTPEKIIERVTIKNENREKELEQEINHLKNQLQQKEFQLKQKEAEVQKLERCLEALNKIWEDRTTVYIDDVQVNHPYLDRRLTDEQLNKMFADQLWQLAENLSGTVLGIERLSFAQKKMLLHIGFSEFHLFKTLAAKDDKEVQRTCFRFQIKRRK